MNGEKVRTILALDLGTTAGWATVSLGGDLPYVSASGIFALPGAAKSRAYHAWRIALDTLWTRLRPSVVAYEEVPPRVQRGVAAQRWGGFEAILLDACEARRTPYIGLTPTQWKAHAGVRLASGPDEALAAARVVWPGYTFATADEAVARWIGMSAVARVCRR
jgi:hypothetical protein